MVLQRNLNPINRKDTAVMTHKATSVFGPLLSLIIHQGLPDVPRYGDTLMWGDQEKCVEKWVV